jgi:hypothetical protein
MEYCELSTVQIYICNLIFKAESGKLRPSKLRDEIAVCLENSRSVVLRV